ncbi:MAG: ribonuclease III [Ignavibacteriaceae bacterium]|nr:ribonuclease III [Ignavibacteriaceae bacterium]
MRLFRFLFKFFSSKIEKPLILKQKAKIEQLIDHEISNPEIFIEALTHRSYLDQKTFIKSNERLEFLGDSFLGFVIARELYSKFQDRDEGFLTKVRSNFVNRNTLAEAAKKINLMDFMYISPELLSPSNPGLRTLLGDVMESFIGAIYLDCGGETAEKFIITHLFTPYINSGLHLIDDNYKSQLLEIIQSLKLELPKYYVIKETGPEHDRIFTVEVRIGNEVLGEGMGRNKKSAEQEAAKKGLQKISSIVANKIASQK